MKRRSLPLLVVILALAACQPPQEFGPRTTDVDLWESRDIRIDTEVPDQYPNGRSGLAGAGASVAETEDAPSDAH